MANVNTPKFRVSYPTVFQPKVNDFNQKEEYSLVALFEKGADLSELLKAAEAAMIKKWGSDRVKWPKNMRNPIRDQGDKEKEGTLPDGHVKGAMFLNLKSTQRPGVVDETLQEIIEPKDFYAGCWARASVSAYAYEVKGNAGVAFGLRNIQKLGDGDPLGGMTRAEDDFEAVASADDNTSASDASSLFG